MPSVQAERLQVAQELRIEMLPGTEIMADIGTHHFVKASSQQVLVPQPSEDPHDPLNWSTRWKMCTFIAASWVTFTQGFGPLALAPMFSFYEHDFSCSLADAIQFTGVSILVLGFSNFFWVPLSAAFGKRFTYITSQLINIGSAIWRAKATSYGSFMGACVLNGIAAGPAETIQPAVIADLFFLHDRGRWNTLYFVCYFGSLMIGPIISGSMALHVGWRNFWWLFVAMLIFSLLLVIFLFPETQYRRDVLSVGTTPDHAGKEKSQDSQRDKVLEVKTHAIPENVLVGQGRPSKQQWALWQPNPNWLKVVAVDFWTPWKMFAFPIVEFASFIVSWSASCYLTVNLTQAQVFAAPPYNFDPQTIGFLNFAVLIGALVGLASAGPLSDWVSMRATLKNSGIREPEMRLPAMIPFVAVMVVGNIIVALGYQYKWPWPVIVVLGFGASGLQIASLPSIASTYAVDSYKPAAGSLFVSITVNKNLWGYGFARFINAWTEEVGFIAPIMTNMALTLLWCAFGILFYYKGKTFRRWSRNSSVHLL